MLIYNLLKNPVGEETVSLEGWIRNSRIGKDFGFIDLNDGTSLQNVQLVLERESLENYEQISKLNLGASLRIKGKVILTPTAKQPFEIKVTNIEVEGESTPNYPLQNKRHSFEFLRDIAHLRGRTNTFSAVFRLRSVVAQAIHRFFEEKNFIYVHTPIITASDCEGAGEMFKVSAEKEDFFDKETGLTVSGQLEGEAFAHAFRNIYTFGPTFRAENSNTPRHAAEFWMIEPEICFAELEDNMQLAEEMLKYIIKTVLKKLPDEMEFFNKFIDKTLLTRLNNVLENDFGRVSYTEAVELLMQNNDNFEYKVFWGCDLQTEHERYLTEKIFQKPIFVYDYPKEIKAFYMRLNDDNKTVRAMDLLVPQVGELIGGSQREERLDILEQRIKELGMNPDDYWWYLDLRRFGGTKHSGYGLGFERAIMYLSGMQNIRDVIPFPRTVGKIQF